MEPNRRQIILHLDASISQLVAEFVANPDVFLTEEDLRSHLIAKLLQSRVLSRPQRTQRQNVRSIPVHSEVRWYGTEDQPQHFRSDVVILNPRQLQTVDPVRTKGYGFDAFYAVVELKLRRTVGCTDKGYKGLITKDFNRLKGMMDNRTDQTPQYYLVCFDKKNKIEATGFDSKMRTDPRVRFQYVFSSHG